MLLFLKGKEFWPLSWVLVDVGTQDLCVQYADNNDIINPIS